MPDRGFKRAFTVYSRLLGRPSSYGRDSACELFRYSSSIGSTYIAGTVDRCTRLSFSHGRELQVANEEENYSIGQNICRED